MQAYPLELGPGQWLALVPDRVRYAEAAEVVDPRRAPEQDGLVVGQAVRARGPDREVGDAARVTEQPRRLQLGERADRVERIVEPFAPQHRRQRWLGRDHSGPAVDGVELGEQCGRLGAEQLRE